MPSNAAAWITGPYASPLVVKEAPYPSPGPEDLVVQTAAVAINPMEYKIQDYNPPIGGRDIQYPMILGSDMAGTIVSVGSDVTRRKVGERVMAHTHGVSIGQPARSAFQHFVIVPEHLATLVPVSFSFEAAAVLPLGCDTAMAGLFVTNQLGLSTAGLGDTDSAPPAPGSALLVWGGSSSVGCCAIQMAHAAGYEVYTVASVRNHGLCSSLGATAVFDHAAPDVEDAIVAALNGKVMVGALDCIVDEEKTVPVCARILARTSGRKKLMMVLSPPDIELAEGVEAQRLSIPSLMGSKTYDTVHAWMTKALDDGTLQPKPDPMVVGEGLGSVQLGLDTIRKGVSAAKVVVRL
ncbi:hypothetical protein LTR36_007248 [Oleoguttula mirabilis]|uniref:Enoyl reductase (ER) domain-containing protein n=1 Tax=Oleoguttula mirabilis TaxID=1507867 RepID=A0AAV9J9V9_9PEZI|nr:hypothetical protein LTR36_007248 [Oleoguttula mirabilis]